LTRSSTALSISSIPGEGEGKGRERRNKGKVNVMFVGVLGYFVYLCVDRWEVGDGSEGITEIE